MGQQTNINIAAPGNMGINTELSPSAATQEWCLSAQNLVVDRAGRLASRRGFQLVTENPDILNDEPLETVELMYGQDGVNTIFCCGDNRIFMHTDDNPLGTLNPWTLYEMTLPAGYTITANNWQMVSFNNVIYFVQDDHQPLYWRNVPDTDPNYFVLEEIDPTGNKPDLSDANCSCAAFGRLWLGGFTAERNVLRWSNLLDGTRFNDNDKIDLSLVWPTGFDEVVAITAHNNFLIVFGLRSIVVFNVPDQGVAYTSVADTVTGIGCVSRDSVRVVGKDVWFLDSTGVRSFGRVMQEKSLPIGDITTNIRTELRYHMDRARTDEGTCPSVKTWYSPDEGLYVLIFPEQRKTYAIDTKKPLQDGSGRVTAWLVNGLYSGARGVRAASGCVGIGGLYLYRGLSDIVPNVLGGVKEEGIQIRYQTGYLDFGAPAALLFPKQVDISVLATGDVTMCLGWAYDYRVLPRTICKKVSRGKPTYFNNMNTNDKDADKDWKNIYNDMDAPTEKRYLYQPIDSGLFEIQYNIWGQGKNISLIITSELLDQSLSIQEINIQATSGRVV